MSKTNTKSVIADVANFPDVTQKFEMVYVWWVDAVSDDAWQSEEAALSGLKDDWVVQSCGFLFEVQDDYIKLVGSVGLEGDVCMIIKIPRGMIRKIEVATPSGKPYKIKKKK